MSYVNCLIALWPALGKSREPPLSERQCDRKLKFIYCIMGVISPQLANLYLNPLDHEMAAKGYAMTRYADDFIVQCQSQAEAQTALELITQWAQENGLTVHPTKTRIVDATQKGGFDFLGYHFERGMK